MPGSRSFFEAGLEEDEMLAALTADGYRITARTFLRRYGANLVFSVDYDRDRAIVKPQIRTSCCEAERVGWNMA
jgi:hypothetical protein